MGKHEVIREVGRLLDRTCKRCVYLPKHGNPFCGGCETEKELRRLGDVLDGTSRGREIDRLLEKAERRALTHSDVRKLLELGADPADVADALDMNRRQFHRYRDLFLRPKRPNETGRGFHG